MPHPVFRVGSWECRQVRVLKYQGEVVFSCSCRMRSTHFVLVAERWETNKKLHLWLSRNVLYWHKTERIESHHFTWLATPTAWYAHCPCCYVFVLKKEGKAVEFSYMARKGNSEMSHQVVSQYLRQVWRACTGKDLHAMICMLQSIPCVSR